MVAENSKKTPQESASMQPMDECHKLLTNKVDLSNPEGHQIPQNINKPLPLGGPPGQVESEREYDISAVYGITHWWFRRKEFYINKPSEPSDREAVRSQMRILSVISVKVFEKYGYNYLREIILRRADYQEYKISEKDFKNLHPNDFEDLFLLNIQEKLNIAQADRIVSTAVNIDKKTWARSLGSGQRLTRDKKAKYFHHCNREKTTDQKDLSKLEKLCWRTHIQSLSFTHCGNKSILRVLRIIIVILPEHPSETMVFHNEDGNPARANIKQALGYPKDGDGDGNSQFLRCVKASANSDVMYFFTSAQDGDPSQDDVRLCLGDDLKKAQDHSQRQA
ncbi:hypothetical protein Tco_0670380 [Tanacetum coccineum]